MIADASQGGGQLVEVMVRGYHQSVQPQLFAEIEGGGLVFWLDTFLIGAVELSDKHIAPLILKTQVKEAAFRLTMARLIGNSAAQEKIRAIYARYAPTLWSDIEQRAALYGLAAQTLVRDPNFANPL